MAGNRKGHALRIAIVIAALVLLMAGGAGAVPVEEWNKTFGGTGTDYAYYVQQTTDGGYILAGTTTSFGAGIEDAWLIKTDSNGNQQWNKTFGGTSPDWVYFAQQTSDGGYILAGNTWSYGAYGGHDAWLIKTDTNGNQQWNKTFGGKDNDVAYSVQQTSDGGYILAGCKQYYYCAAWLIKTDINGNEQWNKTFMRARGYVNSIQQTSDGGYILAGAIRLYGASFIDAWLIKTDVNGNEQWNKTFGGIKDDETYSVHQTTDGGYILAGYKDYSGEAGGLFRGDAWLIKTDINGNEQWSKTFVGAYDDRFYSVQQTSDGGYILTGSTGIGAWLVKTDINGNQKWIKTFGGTYFPWAYSIQQTIDGGYIVAGRNYSGSGLYDAWLIKVSDGGNPTPTLTPTPIPTPISIPTPTPTPTPQSTNTIPTILDPTLSTTPIYKQGTGTPDHITISYLLADADGIASATLYYRLNSGAWKQTSLTRSSGKLLSGYEWWNITIGPFNNNETVSFYLNATDRTGLSARNPSDGSNHSFSVITGTVLEPSLKIDNVVLTPANPIKKQNTKVDVVLSNVGNAPYPAGTLNLYFGVMDFKNKGAVDSIWASTELYGFSRDFSVPEIKNGSSYTISFNDMVFLDSTIPDTLQVTLRYGTSREKVYFYAKDINVVPDPSALLDCGSAVWDTVVANRIIAEAGIKWALVTAKEYSELAQALKSADENAENGDYASTANDLADITAFALEKHIESNAVYYQTLKTSENVVKPVMLIKGILENGPQCTDVLFDSQYTAPYIKQVANALGSGIKAIIVESPVDLIIEDESGNITGINRVNQTFENISDSALIVKGHTKIILLSGNGSYRIRMNGTGSGTFNLTIVSPENNGTASTITYKEIPVNTSTSASLEFSNRTNFTMSIDQNGDGSVDASLSPNTTRNTPPKVTLISPQNNASYYKGQNITFSTNVTNGTSPIKYRWSSSLDGVIGNRSNFSISNLSSGIHIITSKIYDGAGFSNTTTLSLNILNETTPTPAAGITKGDVSGDSLVTVVDALFVAQYTVGLRTLNSQQLAAADVNGDGQVNIVDALFIAQYTVGLRQL